MASRVIELTIAFAIVVGVTLGGSIAHMWVMMNVMQVWFLTGLLDLIYPISIKLVMGALEVANFENAVLSSITEMVFPESFFEGEPFNE